MLTEKDLARFWSKVDKRNENDCWEWLGRKDKDSYGTISIKRKTMRAHRVAAQLTHGELPLGACVCHTCDNPSCVNANHLVVASQQYNVKDRNTKGRTAAGERNGRAKLTESEVLLIRRDCEDKISHFREFGKAYGVHWSTIRDIIWKRIWKKL